MVVAARQRPRGRRAPLSRRFSRYEDSGAESAISPPSHSLFVFSQRLTQGLQRASDVLTSIGPSPLKSLRSALVAGDEEKALMIYTTKEKGGKTLEEDLHPSMPFPLKKHQADTPLHLAAEAALGKLVQVGVGGLPRLDACSERSLPGTPTSPGVPGARRKPQFAQRARGDVLALYLPARRQPPPASGDHGDAAGLARGPGGLRRRARSPCAPCAPCGSRHRSRGAAAGAAGAAGDPGDPGDPARRGASGPSCCPSCGPAGEAAASRGDCLDQPHGRGR